MIKRRNIILMSFLLISCMLLCCSCGKDIEAIAKVVNALKDIPIDLDLTQCTELQSIPENTFSGLQNLVAISLPISVKTIGANAFNNCKGLTHIALGLGITSIGTLAFRNCSNLKRVDYNGTIEQWCNISFENNTLRYVTSASCGLLGRRKYSV